MQEYKISKLQVYATYLSAFSMLMLAAALVYFTIELVSITRQIPEILQTVESTSEKIGPVIEEIAEIRDLVPPILKEIEETRKVVKPAINEYAKTNEQIPRILDEVEATRKTLPKVLKTADNASHAVVTISKEIKATRPLVPKVLAEIEKTRESIPPMMDRADKLVANARDAGKEASEGAVSGMFSGILMAPFALVGDAGKKLVGSDDEAASKLTEKDYTAVETVSNELLELGKVGNEKTWQNKESGSSGTVKLVDINGDAEDDGECRTLRIVVKYKNDTIQDKNTVMCKGSNGKWDFE